MTKILSKENFQKGLQRFSDGTSMHGFTELYYSKTLFWKLLWVVLVTGSIIVTIYQLCGAVRNFVFQSSGTMILPATYDQLHYPPLKFCVAHWIFWLNWDKLYERNFTKETILVGMSYLTNVYSNHFFNITEAEHNFTIMLEENNITTMTDFYQTFAHPFSTFGFPNMNETEFILADLENPYFCYTISGDKLKQTLKHPDTSDTSGSKMKNVFELNWNDIKQTNVDQEEYNSYMAEWIYTKTTQYYLFEDDLIQGDYSKVRLNYSAVIPPNILFADGYGEISIKLLPQIDEYFISVKSGGSHWKNTKSRKCLENVVTFLSNGSCPKYCNSLAYFCYSNISGGIYFVQSIQLHNITIPSQLLKNKIYFLNHSIDANNAFNTSTTNPMMMTELHNTSYTEENTTYNDIYGVCRESHDLIYNNCIADFCTIQGCDVWSFDVSVTTRSLNDIVKSVAYKKMASAMISYPSDGEVLMITETDSKTWEDFVGNVGGLLGIWTGASIISIFQLFYLCCFADVNGHSFSLPKLLVRKNARKLVSNEISTDKPEKPNIFVNVFKKRGLKRIKSTKVEKCKIVNIKSDEFGMSDVKHRTAVIVPVD